MAIRLQKNELPFEREQRKQVTRRGRLIHEFNFQFNVICDRITRFLRECEQILGIIRNA